MLGVGVDENVGRHKVDIIHQEQRRVSDAGTAKK